MFQRASRANTSASRSGVAPETPLVTPERQLPVEEVQLGAFLVASHVYASTSEEGPYHVLVTVTDFQGGESQFNPGNSAADAGPCSATETVAFQGTVGTFLADDRAPSAPSCRALISWGDDQTSPAAVN